MNLNQITYRQIEALTDVQLSRVLRDLLLNEAAELKFETVTELFVPLKINVSDDGEDGLLDCESINGSLYIRNKHSIFQCKAKKMSPTQIFAEFFSEYKKAGKAGEPPVVVMKERIKSVLVAGGQYVIFVSKPYNTKSKNLRLLKAYEAINLYNSIHGTIFEHSQIRIIEGEEISVWVNKFIDVVVRIQEFNQIHRTAGLQTIEQLGNLPENNQFRFHSNDVLNGHMVKIQEAMDTPKASLRIIGHSGLGKTRLVYEAFKNSKNKSAIYYKVVSNPQEILNFVIVYGTSYQGTLIVDDCDYATHRQLKQQIQRSNSTFQLISIDFNVSEETEPSAVNEEQYIFLKKDDYKDIVKMILNDQYEHKLDLAHIDQIADYAEGFPGMAVLFANARIDGKENLSELLHNDIIYRIAFGRDWSNPNEGKYNMLKAFSIFSTFFKPAENQLDVITEQQEQLADAQKDFISGQICRPVQQGHGFLESADYFERSRVMERRGHYLMVKPTPLAIKLATEWWRYTDAKELVKLFPELERIGLAVPLVNRLAELDQLGHAKRIVNQVWGPNSPFGKAEVLNTPLGSRIFRSIAHVNPESALQTLYSAFGDKTIAELKTDFGPGRRNIIWALEALVFRADLFQDAAYLLFKFALAENENIANNATGQFLHLFHIVLAGTSVDLVERLALIDRLLAEENADARRMVILAMRRGLKGDSFRRDIGAENRGSSAPLIDFYPTWAQSAGYWDGLIERLSKIAKDDVEERASIKSTFARAIRNLFYDRLPFLVEKAILLILEFDNSFWEEAISQIKSAIEYEDLSEDDIKLTERLLSMLKPTSLEDELRFYVSTPIWNFEKGDSETYIDHTAIAAENFAEKIVNENIDLRPILEQMQTGEQRKSYAFGRKLGELSGNLEFAKQLIHVLANVPKEKQNPEIAAAYTSALSENDKLSIYELVLQTPGVSPHGFYFARIIDLPAVELFKLFKLVDQEKAEIQSFHQFAYGRGLQHLTVVEIRTLFEKIASYPEGDNVSLELSHEFIGKDVERWNEFKPFLSNLVTYTNLMMRRTNHSTHAWNSIITRLIDENGIKPFTAILTQQLLEAVRADYVSSFDGYLTSIVRRMVTEDFKHFWDIISPSILTSDFSNLRFFMASHNGNMGSPGLLDTADIDVLIDWCKQVPELGSLRITRMMPVTPIGDVKSWHPLAMAIIDNFGNSAKVLDEIHANINSFGSVGSRVPYLRDQQELISKLFNHPIERVRKWSKSFAKEKEMEIKRSAVDEQSYYINM